MRLKPTCFQGSLTQERARASIFPRSLAGAGRRVSPARARSAVQWCMRSVRRTCVRVRVYVCSVCVRGGAHADVNHHHNKAF